MAALLGIDPASVEGVEALVLTIAAVVVGGILLLGLYAKSMRPKTVGPYAAIAAHPLHQIHSSAYSTFSNMSSERCRGTGVRVFSAGGVLRTNLAPPQMRTDAYRCAVESLDVRFSAAWAPARTCASQPERRFVPASSKILPMLRFALAHCRWKAAPPPHFGPTIETSSFNFYKMQIS
jgi:hypothetical protein